MLNPGARVDVVVAPQIIVYRDDEERERFYVVPIAPRIAFGDDGSPDLHLLLYGHKREGVLEISGGQLTLVTSLALGDEERIALLGELTQLLVAEAAPAAGPPPSAPVPNLLPPEWLAAVVTVDFGHGLRVEGNPSMMGDNQCALHLQLTAEGAAALHRDWEAGLTGATLEYRGEVSCSGTSKQSSHESSRMDATSVHGERSAVSDFSVSLRASRAGVLPVTLTGPLGVPAVTLRNRIEIVAL